MVVEVKEKFEKTRHVKNNDKSKKQILRGQRNEMELKTVSDCLIIIDGVIIEDNHTISNLENIQSYISEKEHGCYIRETVALMKVFGQINSILCRYEDFEESFKRDQMKLKEYCFGYQFGRHNLKLMIWSYISTNLYTNVSTNKYLQTNIYKQISTNNYLQTNYKYI